MYTIIYLYVCIFVYLCIIYILLNLTLNHFAAYVYIMHRSAKNFKLISSYNFQHILKNKYKKNILSNISNSKCSLA